MAAAGAIGRTGWRWAGALLLALLALQSVRSAWVMAAGETRPDLAGRVWPGHPAVLFTSAFAGIGTAARAGGPPSAELLRKVEQGAVGAPLAVEPLLVAATARLAGGDLAGGERLLRATIRRDPRSPAAQFLLADLMLRQNRLAEAMDALQALDRRLGEVSTGFAPAIAQYLREPGAVQRMAPILRRNPPLRQAVMSELAGKDDSTLLLLALVRPGDAKEPWFSPAIERLSGKSEVAAVRILLGRVGDTKASGGLSAWPGAAGGGPFGWRFPVSTGGAVEAVAGGPLRLVFYGREDSLLAEHLLLLRPGRYRLAQRLGGTVSNGTFEWRLICLGKDVPPPVILPLPSGENRLPIAVPGGCEAQKLQLFGRAGDFPQSVTAELSGVSLDPLRDGAR